jgi:hypothetical protein
MLSLAFWSNYFRTNRIEIASLIIDSCSAIDFNSFPFFQNQLPLILLNRILDKQFPRVALYVRLSFLVIPRIAPLAYWSQCGRLIQLKQGQNKRIVWYACQSFDFCSCIYHFCPSRNHCTAAPPTKHFLLRHKWFC